MDPLITGSLGFLMMIILILSRVPIALALGGVGICGLIVTFGYGKTLGIIATLPFTSMASYSLALLPLFFMMGDFVRESGIASDAYEVAHKWVGGLPGALAMTTTVACGFSAAALGSSVANAAMFTRIALPEMDKAGYDKGLSLGCIAAAGTFATMIPPSLTFVIYGVIVEQSVGKLLMAGILPGILSVIAYCISIYIRCRWLNPSLAPAPHRGTGWKEKFRALYKLWTILILFTLVMGGMYAGFFTPSSGGAIGAFGALIILLTRRRLRLEEIVKIGLLTARGMGAVMMVIIGGLFFARFLVLCGWIERMVHITTTLPLPPIGIMAMIGVFYLVLGCLMDPLPMILCTVPFIYPIVIELGFDPIWFGVILVKLTEIGCITPPVGVNLFVVAGSADKKPDMGVMIRGVTPFILVELVVLTILYIFPIISLYIPNHM